MERAASLSEEASIRKELLEVDTELEAIQTELSDLLERQDALWKQQRLLQDKLENLTSTNHSTTTQQVDWSANDFPWTDDLYKCLKEKFRIDSFRPLQRESINATLSGRDCILVMPTGGGKSICGQLPALISNGFTLVISPLISLMEDQTMTLTELGISAGMLDSSTHKDTVTEIFKQMVAKTPSLKLLYVTPERLAKSKRFMAKLEKAYSCGNLDRVVIDEVHCVSHWGHDFRPDYKILGILKRQFPNAPLLGLTATASEKVMDDVKDMLNLDGSCAVMRASFNRPNLFYEVYKTCNQQRGLVNEIADRIKTEFPGKSGIVYCLSRKDCEEVSVGLSELGISASCYHAYMEPNMKSKVHRAWTSGKLKVIVATIAFGMGIDKPDVRFVIHYSISKSMENYYQESGRAGRDDQPAKCILYFQFQDIFRHSTMVFTEKTGLQNLYSMLEYCLDTSTCRRKLIGKHFGEVWSSDKCGGMCDNCKFNQEYGETAFKEYDLFADASSVVDLLEQASSKDVKLTPIKVTDAWLGQGKVNLRAQKVSKHSRSDSQNILAKLLVARVLKEDFHFTPYSTISYLTVGPRWKLLRARKIVVNLRMWISEAKSNVKAVVAPSSTHSFDKKIANGDRSRESYLAADEPAQKKRKRKQAAIIVESDSQSDFE